MATKPEHLFGERHKSAAIIQDRHKDRKLLLFFKGFLCSNQHRQARQTLDNNRLINLV